MTDTQPPLAGTPLPHTYAHTPSQHIDCLQLLLVQRTFSVPLRFVFPKNPSGENEVWECMLLVIGQSGLFSFGDESNIIYSQVNRNIVEKPSWKNCAFSEDNAIFHHSDPCE